MFAKKIFLLITITSLSSLFSRQAIEDLDPWDDEVYVDKALPVYHAEKPKKNVKTPEFSEIDDSVDGEYLQSEEELREFVQECFSEFEQRFGTKRPFIGWDNSESIVDSWLPFSKKTIIGKQAYKLFTKDEIRALLASSFQKYGILARGLLNPRVFIFQTLFALSGFGLKLLTLKCLSSERHGLGNLSVFVNNLVFIYGLSSLAKSALLAADFAVVRNRLVEEKDLLSSLYKLQSLNMKNTFLEDVWFLSTQISILRAHKNVPFFVKYQMLPLLIVVAGYFNKLPASLNPCNFTKSRINALEKNVVTW